MSHILRYLEWRGDVPFQLSPVNEIDEYIICKIGVFDWSGIVSEEGRFVPLHQAVEDYFAAGRTERPGVLTSGYLSPMLRALPDTERFGSLELGGYRRLVSPAENKQFSALTIRLPGGHLYVTFRGTDDTIVGWKEDFLLSIEDTIPAQSDATEYLLFAAEAWSGPLTVVGHSKGGNLAVYAASTVSKSVQDRIARVISYDGPGFHKDFLQDSGYQRIRSKITSIMSQQAMVGPLLYHDVDPVIVRSTATGISAHDGHTWETTPTGFVRCEDFSSFSKAFAESCIHIQEDVEREDRIRFVEAFFGTLEETGAVTLTDVSEQRIAQAAVLGRNLFKDPGVQKLFTELMESLIVNYVTVRGRDVAERAGDFLPVRELRKLFTGRPKTTGSDHKEAEDTASNAESEFKTEAVPDIKPDKN